MAVGFLDLGGLCASLRAWEKERFAAESTAPKTPSCGMRNHQPGTLRWIGFDKSLYTVVKTSIIAQMLKMGADVDVIVQVGGQQTIMKVAVMCPNQGVVGSSLRWTRVLIVSEHVLLLDFVGGCIAV